MNAKKNYCIICARAGSKRIKNKNTLSFAGEPLWQHTATFAVKAGIFDEILINTDDQKIIENANPEQLSIYARPDHLSGGHRFVIEIIQEMLTKKGISGDEMVVTMFPTVPIRKVTTLQEAIDIFESHKRTRPVVSIRRMDYPPHIAFDKNDHGSLTPSFPELYGKSTQHNFFDQKYRVTYNVLIHTAAMLLSQKNLVGESPIGFETDFAEAIDIDEQYQFDLAEILYERDKRR